MSPDSQPSLSATWITRQRSLEVPLLLLLALAWLGATAGLRDLSLPDEGRYVGVAWEMLRSGDWLTPTLNGLPFFHKPPLFYWITAASLHLLGQNEWAARVAPMLGGLTAALALVLFARRWVGVRTARWALMAMLAQPLVFGASQYANLDMLVAGMISASILSAADGVLRMEARLPHAPSVWAAWGFAALGVLAKGLIGIVIPALVLGVTLVTARRWSAMRGLLAPSGLAVFLLISAPWFIAMERLYPGFLDYFFVEQHFRRYAGGGFNNVQPFWFYGALLGIACLPWWPSVWRSVRAGAGPDAASPLIRMLMIMWVTVTVVFYSAPASKLVGYVLPALPPLAFLAATGFDDREAAPGFPRTIWWLGHTLMLLVGLAVVIAFAVRPGPSGRQIAEALRQARHPGEPVWMLDRYVYDVPFYARLETQVRVVLDWTDPAVRRRDDWRKEIADAGRFASPLARSALAFHRDFEAGVCARPVNWVIASSDAAAQYPFLAQATRIRDDGKLALWRVETARC
jgi:4-amino-4-deoxy-L-arabinose transferase-like glycosyltransferase